MLRNSYLGYQLLFMLSRRNISSKHAVLTVLCIAGLRLSGIDMMPPPPSAAGAHQEKDDMAVDEGEKSKEMDSFQPSSSKKRPFSEINRKGAGAVPNGSATDLHDESEDSDHKM